MAEPFRIISFDGGGVLGLHAVTMLRRLLAAQPTLIDRTDMLAGTSTGALIALALAAGVPADRVQSLYIDRSADIFVRCHKSVWGLCGPKYRNDGLIRVCRDVFGDLRLGDLQKRVLVPAFDLKSEATPEAPNWRVRFFHNFAGSPDLGEQVWRVAVRTASAPTYFPTYDGYCDGGVACNSPSIASVAQAIASYGLSRADVGVLSVGTSPVRYLDGQDLNWGGLRWLRSILPIFMDAQLLVTDFQGQQMLGERYFRLAPPVPDVGLDDTAHIGTLRSLADGVDLTRCLDFLATQFLR